MGLSQWAIVFLALGEPYVIGVIAGKADIGQGAALLTKREAIYRRDLAADICGSEDSIRSADENRNPATWKKYNMGDWYRDKVKPLVVMDWQQEYLDPPIRYPNIQDANLDWMGNDGVSTCHFIGDDACSPNGRDFNKCEENPEAHFLYIAFNNWNQYLQSIVDSFDVSTTSLTALTSTLRDQFFTPRGDPTELLVPVGVVSGIAGAISGFYGPVALVAGAGAIASAIIIQAGLDQVDPTEQWGDVQAAIGSAFTQIVNATENFFNTTMLELPETRNNPITYDVDPTQTPTLFYEGTMAGPVSVGLLNNGIYGALAASAINALWASDGVFIMRISDSSYDDGKGTKACDAFPEATICANDPGLKGSPWAGGGDLAYIWLRQSMTGGFAVGEGGIAWSTLNEDSMWVWGAYGRGKADGTENANSLETYGLNLVSLTKSALETFQENGFPFNNQNGATINALKKNPADTTLETLLHISLPICNIDAILGGKKLTHGNYKDENPIVRYGACTCAQWEKWPSKVNGEETVYTPDVGGIPPDQCRKESWK